MWNSSQGRLISDLFSFPTLYSLDTERRSNMTELIYQHELIKVFQDTVHQSNTLYAKETEILKKETKLYQNIPVYPSKSTTSDVAFIHGGTIEISNQYCDRYKVAALNFADGVMPGGMVKEGALTQEENICRCSNLYQSLTSEACIEGYYKINQQHYHSGLCTNTIIYSPNVLVFKDDKNFSPITPKQYDIITCPAPSCKFTCTQDAMNVYETRIKQILLSAIINHVDCLILGAWGCGAFGQDKKLISLAFVNVLNEYAGYFKKIIFAIKETPTLHDSSYDTFLQIFQTNYRGNTLKGDK